MMMMGLEVTGKPPFHTIYMHGLVRDAQGQKMSKTKGNVVDPIEASGLASGLARARARSTTPTRPPHPPPPHPTPHPFPPPRRRSKTTAPTRSASPS